MAMVDDVAMMLLISLKTLFGPYRKFDSWFANIDDSYTSMVP
jgi:hypothetical protein